jgi:Na+/glutamate symporter
MTPELQPDVEMVPLLLYAAFNPATIAIAYMIGRQADQLAKIFIPAFAGAIAGVVLLNIAALVGVPGAPNLARASAGIFTVSLVVGLLYAWIGFKRARPGGSP